MKKIDIYQMDPEFILGDSQNLQALKKKLNEDAILLYKSKLTTIMIEINLIRNLFQPKSIT